MKRSALFLPALALAVSLVAAGCGGSSDDSSDGGDAPAASISKADFTEQANKICADASTELQAASADLTDASTPEEVNAFITDTAVPNFQAQHDAIADLGAPEGDEDAVDTLLTSLQDAIDTMSDDPEVFAADSSTFDDANAAANDLGLTDCGSSS